MKTSNKDCAFHPSFGNRFFSQRIPLKVYLPDNVTLSGGPYTINISSEALGAIIQGPTKEAILKMIDDIDNYSH